MAELPAGTLLSEQYRIEAPIGTGRTGTVYRARDTKLQRDVAVRIGHHAGVFAIAKLSHPNVVTVFEVGERDDRPFVVTEYVRGETAHAWLHQPRSWREIVDLFIDAGEGLAAAHRAGVQNGDFKSEHILIDEKGRPRVAALELATAEEQLSEQRAFSTALKDALGDLAVPARVRRVLGESYSGMFALLVALRGAARPRRGRWFVLAGSAIVVATGLAWFVHAHHRQQRVDACEQSARAADVSLGSGIAVEYAYFRTGLPVAVETWRDADRAVDNDVARWRRKARDVCVAFEIDHSTTKALHDQQDLCLERARIEIAATVERLAEIDRTHLPQTGRLVGSLPDLAVCERAETMAPVDPQHRDRLERYFTKLAEVESLDHAGRYAAAAKQSTELTTLAHALDSRRDEAQVDYLAGQIEKELGHFKECARLYEQALTLAEAASDDALVAAIANGLVDVVGNNMARYQDAQQYVKYARAAAQRVGHPEARARISETVGRVELVAGHFDEAGKQLEDAMKAAEEDKDSSVVAAIAEDFSRLASARGRPAQAEPYDRRALALYTAEYGPEHPVTMTALSNLATTLASIGRYDEARRDFEQVLTFTERTAAPDSEELAYALNNTASTAAQAGDNKRARTLLERSLVIFEKNLGPSHPTVGTVVKNLGDIASYEGQFDDATTYYKRALDIQRKAVGDHHPDVVTVLLSLSEAAFERNAPGEAIAYCDQAREALGKTEDNPTLQNAIDTCRGQAELDAGHLAGALEILELAAKRQAKIPDMDPSAVASTQFLLARALVTRSPARALRLAHSARDLFEHEGAFATRALAEVDAWLKAHEH